MGMDSGDGNGKDMRNMQTLAPRQDASANSGTADRYLPATPPLAVPAAACNVRELCDGGGQGDSSSRGMAGKGRQVTKTLVLVEIEHTKPLPSGSVCVTDLVAQRVYDWLIARNCPSGVRAKLLDDVMREAE